MSCCHQRFNPVPKTYRKFFTHAELQKILGERTMAAHGLPSDNCEYHIALMLTQPENKQWTVRAEVTPTEEQPSPS